MHLIKDNILKADTEAIVNPVNCVGVMGKGLALKFKEIYPQNYLEYLRVCNNGELTVGRVHVYQPLQIFNPKYIINFPTKNHWRDHSKYSYIDSGLISIRNAIIDMNIKSISIPALGCGLGGLVWYDVKELIINRLYDLQDNTEIYLYEPIDIGLC